MIYGYARVSSRSQIDNYSLAQQEQEILGKYPGAVVYKEQFTGTTVHRPVFDDLISKLQSGDVLAVTKLDRFARSTIEGMQLVQELFGRGVAVHVFNVGLLEDTAMGKFFVTLMLAVAELERNNIVERTQNGKAIAKQDPNYKEGRPAGEYPGFEKISQMKKDGLLTVKEGCERLGISRSQWYALEKKLKKEQSIAHPTKDRQCPADATPLGDMQNNYSISPKEKSI